MGEVAAWLVERGVGAAEREAGDGEDDGDGEAEEDDDGCDFEGKGASHHELIVPCNVIHFNLEWAIINSLYNTKTSLCKMQV